ncbi:MAG TPA: DUF1990 family protein [Solirubrobacterales bacterium]|nr:DUF1990 family protein [Solirubrobacterales bacterium]
MSTTIPLHRRWSTALRWPYGVALASWRYMWSTTPVHRWVMTGSWREDAPPPLPPGFDHPELQGWEDGVGPLLHRIYRTRFTASPMSARELIAELREDMDKVAPTEFATFQKAEGEGPMREGDEFVVRMPGPWDGPVAVAALDESSIRLATLEGHLEAGQIEYRAREDHRGVVFEIESWARSGDRLSDLLYTHVQISREVQLHMWASVLRNVVDLAGGKMDGGIVITTRRVDPEAIPRSGEEDSGPGRKDERALADLAGRPVNHDPGVLEQTVDPSRWRLDETIEALPHEKPGAPEPGGSWEVAKRMMDGYQLADPRIVEGVFDPASPLSGRDMLLKIRYGPLRFKVGVRVGDAREETVEADGRPLLRYGWSYRTLQGHFEEGEMRYELRKWLDSGDVEFRVHGASRAARSGPLIPRLGFRLVGRPQQLRFYRQVCRRAKRLTEAQLETERAMSSRRKANHSS